MLWEVDIHPSPGQPDRLGMAAALQAVDLGIRGAKIRSARGFLIEGRLDQGQAQRIAAELLADSVVERALVARAGEAALSAPDPDWAPKGNGSPALVHVLPKPGVMDPVAQSALDAIRQLGLEADAVRTLTKYWIAGLEAGDRGRLCSQVLANDAIEQVVIGTLGVEHLEVGAPYRFELVTVPLSEMDQRALESLSRERHLYLSLVEMQTIQQHFRDLGRDPTDAELDTLAQTWSEHCSHKTLAGRIHYCDERGERTFENLLRETIFAATHVIREKAGDDDLCVSVFSDNAGIVRFDDDYNAVFKVETHNHPSALEPYGGANTGLGGVIRDPLGTGLGAQPVCNTNVFCFAPPDTPQADVPAGVLHPRRVMHGVVAGVRDYGNRMGIPTVNGAIYFDPRYLGNPLVYCGTVGIIPRDKSSKSVAPGDYIVAVGGRTGRDGIHGATFSSAELTTQSESVSGGAVQIGNAITEKMLLDVLLVARDSGFYRAITDCGAGGFSSAIGEMGETIGAEVWLERAPLKYAGLSYTEIWISEAQERMVVAIDPVHFEGFRSLCAAEGVEATIVGRFVPTGRLVLKYDGHQVADLSMEFLHRGRPKVLREAVYHAPAASALDPKQLPSDHERSLLAILGSLNVASKHWVIRQYDHEVQGGSVIKPLVGLTNDGPSDAAVVRPVLESRRGLVVGCGMNPYYGDFDTYHMATSAIDEAVRNCVAVGADPRQIAILDNFCWAGADHPETLGSLVRAAIACYDVATVLGTPFISGKDSLNNEFRHTDASGANRLTRIPPSLLISALGQIADVGRAVTMDLKRTGNLLFVVGVTRYELGGSHCALVNRLSGGQVPKVEPEAARRAFAALHAAIDSGTVRACHDLSEGGLAVSAAEMAFAGGLGARLDLDRVPHDLAPAERTDAVLLFAESNTRFLCEVSPDQERRFVEILADVAHARMGEVTDSGRLEAIGVGGSRVLAADVQALKRAWQAPLDW